MAGAGAVGAIFAGIDAVMPAVAAAYWLGAPIVLPYLAARAKRRSWGLGGRRPRADALGAG